MILKHQLQLPPLPQSLPRSCNSTVHPVKYMDGLGVICCDMVLLWGPRWFTRFVNPFRAGLFHRNHIASPWAEKAIRIEMGKSVGTKPAQSTIKLKIKICLQPYRDLRYLHPPPQHLLTNLEYKSHHSRRYNCWPLTCSWSSAYIFISRLNTRFQWIGQRQLRDEARNM